MQNPEGKKPEIIVFAGPNGSGKSTIARMAKIIEPYINADDIKRTTQCDDLEAAKQAEALREKQVALGQGCTFEMVLSTERNLNLLRKAKEKGFFIRCIYVLTADVAVNIMRVRSRFAAGVHDVPKEKIKSRYTAALSLIPALVEICDIVHIYDNTDEPYRIFKKRKDAYFYWENMFWDKEWIELLTGRKL